MEQCIHHCTFLKFLTCHTSLGDLNCTGCPKKCLFLTKLEMVSGVIVRRLNALCVSFNRTAPDPTSGGLKNQEKISQFSTAPDQLPNMRHQFYSKELLNLVFNPSS